MDDQPDGGCHALLWRVGIGPQFVTEAIQIVAKHRQCGRSWYAKHRIDRVVQGKRDATVQRRACYCHGKSLDEFARCKGNLAGCGRTSRPHRVLDRHGGLHRHTQADANDGFAGILCDNVCGLCELHSGLAGMQDQGDDDGAADRIVVRDAQLTVVVASLGDASGVERYIHREYAVRCDLAALRSCCHPRQVRIAPGRFLARFNLIDQVRALVDGPEVAVTIQLQSGAAIGAETRNCKSAQFGVAVGCVQHVQLGWKPGSSRTGAASPGCRPGQKWPGPY